MQSERLIRYRCTLQLALAIAWTQNLLVFSEDVVSPLFHEMDCGSSELENHVGLLAEQDSVTLPPLHAIRPEGLHIRRNEEIAKRSPFVPDGYLMIWHDEFNATELDISKWGYRREGQSSDGSGVSVLSRNCVSLDGRGHLQIATKEDDGVLQTGMISTNGTFEPVYGYFEARIRFQRQQGHHGAFWLKPSSYGKFPGDPGRSGVELDIAEFFGSGRRDRGMGVNIYWKNKDGEIDRCTTQPDLTPILSTTSSEVGLNQKELCDHFHVFNLLWSSTHYEFSVDGHKILTTEDGLSHQGQPIILSLLSHKWESGKFDRDNRDDAMLVDYVRVYQVDTNSSAVGLDIGKSRN